MGRRTRLMVLKNRAMLRPRRLVYPTQEPMDSHNNLAEDSRKLPSRRKKVQMSD